MIFAIFKTSNFQLVRSLINLLVIKGILKIIPMHSINGYLFENKEKSNLSTKKIKWFYLLHFILLRAFLIDWEACLDELILINKVK